MASIKISSKVEQAEWKALQDLARESHQSISGLPDSPVQFLSLDEVLAIHERLIGNFGGDHGVRDRGLLESALFRPQTGYYTYRRDGSSHVRLSSYQRCIRGRQ